jgi:hypothetical protein
MDRVRKEREEREEKRKEFLAMKEKEAEEMRQKILDQKRKLEGTVFNSLKCKKCQNSVQLRQNIIV